MYTDISASIVLFFNEKSGMCMKHIDVQLVLYVFFLLHLATGYPENADWSGKLWSAASALRGLKTECILV